MHKFATTFDGAGIYFAKSLKEPVEGEYYYPTPGFGGKTVTENGKRYKLWLWRDSRKRVQEMGYLIKQTHPWIRYVTRMIVFCKDPKSKTSPAIHMYGLYLRKEE